jgi:hypothetical protein
MYFQLLRSIKFNQSRGISCYFAPESPSHQLHVRSDMAAFVSSQRLENRPHLRPQAYKNITQYSLQWVTESAFFRRRKREVTDGQTDRQTDRRTNGRTDGNDEHNSAFFHKWENVLKRLSEYLQQIWFRGSKVKFASEFELSVRRDSPSFDQN